MTFQLCSRAFNWVLIFTCACAGAGEIGLDAKIKGLLQVSENRPSEMILKDFNAAGITSARVLFPYLDSGDLHQSINAVNAVSALDQGKEVLERIKQIAALPLKEPLAASCRRQSVATEKIIQYSSRKEIVQFGLKTVPIFQCGALTLIAEWLANQDRPWLDKEAEAIELADVLVKRSTELAVLGIETSDMPIAKQWADVLNRYPFDKRNYRKALLDAFFKELAKPVALCLSNGIVQYLEEAARKAPDIFKEEFEYVVGKSSVAHRKIIIWSLYFDDLMKIEPIIQALSGLSKSDKELENYLVLMSRSKMIPYSAEGPAKAEVDEAFKALKGENGVLSEPQAVEIAKREMSRQWSGAPFPMDTATDVKLKNGKYTIYFLEPPLKKPYPRAGYYALAIIDADTGKTLLLGAP